MAAILIEVVGDRLLLQFMKCQPAQLLPFILSVITQTALIQRNLVQKFGIEAFDYRQITDLEIIFDISVYFILYKHKIKQN